MNLEGIYVHDGMLIEAHEDCGTQTLVLDVDLPADEWSEDLVPKRITLREVYGYCTNDGPFEGTPAILEIDKIEEKGRWTKYHLGTNAGTRVFWTSGFSIEDRKN